MEYKVVWKPVHCNLSSSANGLKFKFQHRTCLYLDGSFPVYILKYSHSNRFDRSTVLRKTTGTVKPHYEHKTKQFCVFTATVCLSL